VSLLQMSADRGDVGPAENVVSGTLVVLEQSKIITAVARALMFLGPLMFLAFVAKVFPPGAMGVHLLIAGAIARRFQRRHNLTARRQERRVRIAREGVFVDGVLTVRREEIADGHFQPRPPRDPDKKRSLGSSVRLLDKGKHILFEGEVEEPQAVEILHLLGLDVGRRRAEFSGSSPLYATTKRNLAFVWGTFASAIAIGFVLGALGLESASGVAFLFVFPVVLGGMWPSRIAVGVDGILVRWLSREHFTPMSQIVSAHPLGNRAIGIQLTSGEVKTIYTSMARSRGLYAVQRRDAALARIREALTAHRAGVDGPPTVDVAALVGRGSRTGSDWIDELGKLREGEGGYRSAVVRDDDLWSVVEDPTAAEDARAGAAMALRKSLDQAGKTRVRVAAEATASPKLRVALDAVAEESDEEAAAALQAFTGDEDAAQSCDLPG
jgi:hypothetical protein